MKKTMLITTSTCGKCTEAKKWLDEQKIEYQTVIADQSPDQMEIARKYQVSGVPKIVLVDEASKESPESSSVLEVKDYQRLITKQQIINDAS